MLSSARQVIWALVTYTDWCHPMSTSILQVGNARRHSGLSEGIPEGLLDTLDERTELRRRMQFVDERDRHLLFLWYIKQLDAQDIAREIGVSRRQCFRRRARAVRQLVELGEPSEPDAAA
jgi:DNA-directed RNA polymerase specialized sigma subunit